MRYLITLLIVFPAFTLRAQLGGYKPGLEHPVEGAPPGAPVYDLQPLLDSLQKGDTLRLEAALYRGPGYIRTAGVVIDGQGHATVTGNHKHSVLYIEAPNVTVQNLKIIDSGHSPDDVDCAIKVNKQNHFVIYNNKIENTLFGIDVFWAQYGKILHNDITSIASRPKGLKGDAIRFWYSKHNITQENYWHQVRDMVVWYSSDNEFIGNRGDGNRYSIHFMYSHNNHIAYNHFLNSSVGVFLMYSERTIMNNNVIENSQGVTGMCLGMKETSSNQILDNRFLYSARGMYIDVSPFVPWKENTISGNEIAFCGTGIEFLKDQEGNVFTENLFHDNLQQIFVQGGGGAYRNKWIGNYWDDYEGFDKDGDNVGDMPYRLYEYHARLWRFNKDVKFFFGSPVLSLLDYLEKLAPFSKPTFILKDKTPIYNMDEYIKKRQKFKNLYNDGSK